MTHIHGPEGEHAHGATAFTTWLDPTLALKQANAIRATLAKLHPQNADDFQKNFDELKGDLGDRDLCTLARHQMVTNRAFQTTSAESSWPRCSARGGHFRLFSSRRDVYWTVSLGTWICHGWRRIESLARQRLPNPTREFLGIQGSIGRLCDPVDVTPLAQVLEGH